MSDDSPKMKPDKRAALLKDAGSQLSKALGASLTLTNPRKLSSQHFMFRCDVQGGGADLATAIIKKMDLDRDDGEGNHRFRNEWASLEFLTALEIQPPLAPRLLASDLNAGYIVMEDLGDHPDIQELMFADDDGIAEEALVQMGALLGSMHAATVGREAEFRKVQATLGAQTPLSDGTLDMRERMQALHDSFAALRVETTPAFFERIAALEADLQSPQHPFRAFAHCDAGAHNFLYTPDGVRGMDFEFGGYACGLTDIVPARLGFPLSFRGHRVPAEVVMQMEDAYRDALAAGVPAAADDDHFNRVRAEVCAHWAFSRIEGLWRNYLQSVIEVGEERTLEELGVPEGRVAPFRRKVYTYVSHFVQTAVDYDELPELRKPVKGFLRGMRHLWPDIEVMPYYPAWATGADADDD
jgi:hypothetical protein